VEHEVSVITGYQAFEAIDKSRYDAIPVYIARDNVWYVGEELASIAFFRQEHPPLDRLTRVFPCPDAASGKLRLLETRSGWSGKRKILTLDCIIPATHGTFGEDGCLQGLLEMAGVPYAGSGVAASAIGMDKLLTKAVLAKEGLPHLDYCATSRAEFQHDPNTVLARVETRLGYPVFVKPAVLGSSVAISRANDRASLETALDLAQRFCARVLVERALVDPVEINCALLDGDPPLTSVLEQPLSAKELLTFEEKYRGGKKGAKGMAGLKRLIPAPISEAATLKIKSLAVQTFTATGAGGVARVDFLMDKDGEIYVNEINNIPGSFAYYLWEFSGRSFRELLDHMIERAFEVQRLKNQTTYTFEANLLAGRG
jgi:D-alanine-D-alanine ligase